MAQGDPRPRHSRQSSRIPKYGNADDDGVRKPRTTGKSRPSDEATENYIKRSLCVQPARLGSPTDSTQSEIDARPLDELLPPLTSSNAVDLQLYAVIAVILNQFVQNWYNRITPDQEFVEEIVHIIAHCTRGLEQRLRATDLEELLLEDLPALFIAHIDAVQVAQNTFSDHRSQDEIRMIYHTIHTNKALTPLPDNASNALEQLDNETAWSQLLVAQVLPLVLPPEDLQNPCLHVLVSEILSEMIVHNAICGKASEAWLIWEGVTKLIRVLRPDLHPHTPADGTSPSSINKLEQFGLLSSAAFDEKQDLQKARGRRADFIAQVFWTTLQVLMTAWLLLRSFTIALMHASSIPARQGRVGKTATPDKVSVSAVVPGTRPSPQHTILTSSEKRPVVSMKVWTCISRLTAIEERMPWLSGLLSLLQWLSLYGPGGLCRTNSLLDRLMAAEIDARLSRPDLLPSVLQAIRSALFPDNALAAARVPPTDAETAEIKRVCANTIVEVIPRVIRSRYFGTSDLDLARQDVETTLDLFADPYINKHLIISAVELIVVRLFPELGEDDENG